MKRIIILATAAVLVIAPIVLGFGAGSASAQAPFSVSVETPDEFSTDGSQTIVVNVTNDGSTDLLNPIVEVPIQSPLSLAPNQSTAVDSVYINDDPAQGRTANVSASTFTGGDALVITGTEVPAGESRTYHFNVSVSNPSTVTIESDVRPLYNVSNNARGSTTAEVLGTGEIDATVEDVDGNVVGNASAVVDGQAQGPNVTETVAEGERSVRVQGLGPDYPEFTVDVGVGETTSVTFIERDNTQQIQPVGFTQDDVSRVTDSVSRNDGSPTTKVNTTISYTFAMSSGSVVYEVQDPSVPVQNDGVVTVTDGDVISTSTTTEGARQFEINNTPVLGTTQVDIEYEGFNLGDTTRDGSVNIDDAEDVAGGVAADNRPSEAYADVNDDGTVDSVDAMLIAQFSNKSSNDPSSYTGVK